MNTIQDVFLNGSQSVEYIRESCSRNQNFSGEFYTVAEPMVAYKKLASSSIGHANIAKLIIPAGSTIFVGELFRFMDWLPDGRPDENGLYNGGLESFHREVYEGLQPDSRNKIINWRWFIRRTDSRKMRASEAFVESIFSVNLNAVEFHFEEDGEVVVEAEVLGYLAEGFSAHDWNFKYEPGATVKPKNGLCPSDEQCSDGIHFFFNLADALAYAL